LGHHETSPGLRVIDIIELEGSRLKLPGFISALLLLVLATGTAYGADVLLETQTSWDGGSLAYPTGKARVTSVMLHIEPGDEPPFHCHPVPTMGYVLRGTLEVETERGDTQRIEAGSALVEVMNTLHRGRAVSGPVDIIVFYAGAEGVPTTVLPGGDDAGAWPCGAI
jgi:quercetin dioxygenase-like cupin family protein